MLQDRDNDSWVIKIFLIILIPTLLLSLSACTSSPPPVNEIIENKATPTPTQTPTPKPNFETDEKLQKQSDALLHFFDNMPQVPVYLKDEPILKTGSETQKGVAYTMCELNNSPAIFMKKVFFQKANQKQLTNILKHELTHAWFCRQGVKVGHDERWRKKFKEVGGIGN